MRVVFTPLAERQIDKLHDDITKRASEERADGHVSRIIDYCTGFSTFPERGRRRDDIIPGLRVAGFERRVTIAYLVTAEAVLIEGIFYGGQDFETALRSDFKGLGTRDRQRTALLHLPRPAPTIRHPS